MSDEEDFEKFKRLRAAAKAAHAKFHTIREERQEVTARLREASEAVAAAEAQLHAFFGITGVDANSAEVY